MSEHEIQDAGPRRSLLHSPYLWAVLAGLILIPAMRPFLRHEPAPPAVQFELPEFRLVDSRGAAFGSDDLDGRVYVADFIFTRCGSICPALTRSMKLLDRRFRERGVDGVHLVSITVDPTYDTPEVLARYADEHAIDLERWTLLTGPPASVRSLVIDGFRLGLGQAPETGTPPESPAEIAHSGKLVLVDGSGGVRGYYDADGEGLDEVFHRTLHVLKQGSR
ncbi:MAG TPA: SCO family protein [Candidatus Polarisedimenticolaceae bacterium]|nr:SCO family protein [Candidatus Polarisedimenticolaceae bacterium]